MKFSNLKARARFSFMTVVALLAFGSFSVNAQEMTGEKEEATGNTPGTFNFGGHVGLTLGYFSNNHESLKDDNGNLATKKGMTLGGFFTYHLTDWLSARGELNWIQTGHVNLEGDTNIAGFLGNATSVNRNITINYIDVPVMVVLNPKNILEKWNPSFRFGPSIAWNVGTVDERTVETTESSYPFLDHEVVNSEFSGFTASLNFGAGVVYELPSMPFDLTFDFKYRVGLNNINDGIASPALLRSDVQDNTLMFTVGCRL